METLKYFRSPVFWTRKVVGGIFGKRFSDTSKTHDFWIESFGRRKDGDSMTGNFYMRNTGFERIVEGW